MEIYNEKGSCFVNIFISKEDRMLRVPLQHGYTDNIKDNYIDNSSIKTE